MHQELSQMPDEYTPASCGGERCSMCGKPAQRKVEENIFHDDPQPMRHPLTAYVFLPHFEQIMDRGGYTRAASVPVQSIKEYPDTLPEDQRISQPETTGSSEVDRSERVFINSPSDKDRAEALEWLNDVRFYAVAGGHDNPEDFKRRSQKPADEFAIALKESDPVGYWKAKCEFFQGKLLNAPDQTETKPTSDEVVNALVEALESVEYHSPMTAGQKESIPKIQQALALAKKVGV